MYKYFDVDLYDDFGVIGKTYAFLAKDFSLLKSTEFRLIYLPGNILKVKVRRK